VWPYHKLFISRDNEGVDEVNSPKNQPQFSYGQYWLELSDQPEMPSTVASEFFLFDGISTDTDLLTVFLPDFFRPA